MSGDEENTPQPAGDGGDMILGGSASAPLAGDSVYLPGRGGLGGNGAPNGRDGRLIFKDAQDNEILVFQPCGKVLVRGEEVAHNRAVYAAFTTWLFDAVITGGAGDPDGGSGAATVTNPDRIKEEPDGA